MRMWAMLATAVWLTGGLLALAACSGGAKLPEPGPEATGNPLFQDRAAYLLSVYPDVELPDVEFERYVTESDRETLLEGCFAELGVDVSIDAAGGMSGRAEGPDGMQALEIAMYACAVRYPDSWARGFAMSIEERGYLHDYYSFVVTPCIRSAGYPPPKLPDRETFLLRQVPWSVYEYVTAPRLGKEAELRWSELMLRCPELPAGWDDR